MPGTKRAFNKCLLNERKIKGGEREEKREGKAKKRPKEVTKEETEARKEDMHRANN